MSRKFGSKFVANTIMTIFRPLQRFAMDLHAFGNLNAVQNKTGFERIERKARWSITNFGFANGLAYTSLDC